MASIRWKLSLTVLGCAALLAGCASVREVQSDVQSFSALTALPAPPTYRLELLPSQQAQALQFAAIEAQAQQALAFGGAPWAARGQRVQPWRQRIHVLAQQGPVGTGGDSAQGLAHAQQLRLASFPSRARVSHCGPVRRPSPGGWWS